MTEGSTISHLSSILMGLQDPDYVRSTSTGPCGINADPIIPQGSSWSDLSLANGYPSLVLLFAMLVRKGLGGDNAEHTLHRYIVKIKEVIESEGIFSLSLYGGVAGICFALKTASWDGKKYSRFLNTLDNLLLHNFEDKYLKPLQDNIEKSRSSPSYLYDPIQGVAGIGRYALENLSSPQFVELSKKIGHLLVSFCEPKMVKGVLVPGWHVEAADPINSIGHTGHSNGNFNLGLAHGVTGILAYLSILSLKGLNVSGQNETIRLISDWLCKRSICNANGIQWPANVSWEEESGKLPFINHPTRDAWCYGVPGIARTLFLAGVALNDEKLKSFSLDAFRGVFSRTREEWNLPGPSLCHGIAGLLLTTYQMALETSCEVLQSKVSELEQMLLTYIRPDAPFGFNDVEACRSGGTTEVCKPGFLEGSTGIILTLLSLSDPKPEWHLPLLIHV